MKNKKNLVLSAVGALAFASIAVGTTFALFTSKAETNIEVNSGVIDVNCNVTISNVYELNRVEPLEPSSTGVYTNSIGGTTSVDGNIISLNNWAPGDKVVLDVQNVNKSTVKALTRLAISHGTVGDKGDLYPALDITIKNYGEDEPIDPVELFKWVSRDIPSNPETGDIIQHLTVTIEFPDHDNGEIRFDSENQDNQYQDCACVISLGLEAVQGNAYISPVTTFNEYARYVGDVITMSDAVEAAGKFEYTLADFEGYVWDSKNYQFVSESSVEENFNQYFKAYDAMPNEQPTFSIYANAASWDATVNLTGVGFDAGDTTGITTVNYGGAETARENIIVTNSLNTSITVDAALDTVYHYGEAASLNIIAVANSSYHEFGTIGFTEISKGRIVLEKDSEIKQVHVNKKSDQESFDEVILKDNGARQLPEKITRDSVVVESEKELVVTIEVSDTASEQIYVYAEGNKGTTEQTTEHNTDVESALGTLVLDNGGHPTEKALDTEEKVEEKEEAIIEVIDESDEYEARIGTTCYEKFTAAWNVGDNETVVLLKDLTLNALQVYKTNTIDFNEHTMTLRGHSQAGTTGGAIFIDGGANWGHGNLTLKNGTLNMPGTNFSTYGIYNYGTLSMSDLTVNSACKTALYINGQQWGTAGTTTLDNVTLNSTNSSGTALEAYAFKNSWAGLVSPTVYITDSNITALYNAVNIYACEAFVSDSTITATNNNALWISRSAMASGVTNTLHLSGDMTVNAGSDYKRVHSQDDNIISITTGVYNFDPSDYLESGYTSDYDEEQGVWYVSVQQSQPK